MFALTGIEHRYDGSVVLAVPSWGAARGERWLLAGPSGSGKTTLLAILAGLLRPSAGSVSVGDCDLGQASGADLDRWRGRTVGYVPQLLHLIASLSVLDNLLLAPYLAGVTVDRSAAEALLARVGVEHLASRLPETLSQGQAQRVAIARAVMNRPLLLLADEPTAALDDAHAAQAISLLTEQADGVGATLVVASHDSRIRGAFPNTYRLGVATS
jgi:putative ABC transport system ATP-binding protein